MSLTWQNSSKHYITYGPHNKFISVDGVLYLSFEEYYNIHKEVKQSTSSTIIINGVVYLVNEFPSGAEYYQFPELQEEKVKQITYGPTKSKNAKRKW